MSEMRALPGSLSQLRERSDLLRRGFRQRLLSGGFEEPRHGHEGPDDLCGALRKDLFQIAVLHGCLPHEDIYTGVNGQAEQKKILSSRQGDWKKLYDKLGLTGAEISINHLPAGGSVPFV